MKLAERHFKTLRNLAKLEEGQSVFINTADAEALCDMGLAEAYGAGKHRITRDGKAAVLKAEQEREANKEEERPK